MKAEELMLNDWVECLDSTHKTKVFAQVDAIEESRNCLLVKDGWGNWFLDISHLEPIPLTEEILVKNGFHTYGESYFIPEDKCNAHVRIGFHKRETVVDLHRHGAFSIQISCKPGKLYIHQLQRLLNLCNIDKEIIL